MTDKQAIIQQFNCDGYVVVPALFSHDEVNSFRDQYMALNREGYGFEGDKHLIQSDDDPLAAFPRIVHPHRFHQPTLDWLLDDRLRYWTTALLDKEPYAAQTMYYFKPPGARGQALHQDQRSLNVRPGTCLAAWMAVDPTDENNGCMQVVPGTQDLPELCMIDADTSVSFSNKTVPIPDGASPVPVKMNPGDVLFFNGQVIHGSYPNTTTDSFRCSLIAHYVVGDADKVSEFYHPVLTFDGNEVDLLASESGGPCGIFVNDGDTSQVKLIQSS